MPDPWQVLDRRPLLDRSPWLRLYDEHVRLANGIEIPNYVMLWEPDVALVFAVTPDRHVPLVAQYRHGIGRVAVDLPGGYIDSDEDPLAAAQRELAEETGYAADDWTHLGTVARHTGRGGHAVHLYLARDALPASERHLDHTEDIEVRLTPLVDIMNLVNEGDIVSVSSVAGALWALRSLDQLGEGP